VYKEEIILSSPQGAWVMAKVPRWNESRRVLNLCANNYLGLADNDEVIEAAIKGMHERGFGKASVRFICGTQDGDIELERKMSEFLGTEDTILFGSCFDANGAVFEAILDEQDAIFSDQLVHASIIDGERLAKKVPRAIYPHSNLAELEKQLQEAMDPKLYRKDWWKNFKEIFLTQPRWNTFKKTFTKRNPRFKLIVTDGVFSMDGDMAKLDEIVALAEKYDAMVLVDDSHATGFIGKNGRGTDEYFNVMGKVDIITTTFGKGLGGAAGGCISGRKEIIAMLRQKGRPYLFSNAMPPAIVAGVRKVMDIVSDTSRRDKLADLAIYWRDALTKAGFELKPGNTPIIPIMLYDERISQEFASALLDEGVLVKGFVYPVVAKGQARIRTQMSAGLEKADLEKALEAFVKIGKKLGVLKN